jgi:hypothetical protein
VGRVNGRQKSGFRKPISVFTKTKLIHLELFEAMDVSQIPLENLGDVTTRFFI